MKDKIKILLVDDMSSMRGVIKMFLKSGDFDQIDEASDGEQAWKRLSFGQYNIVICDWDMPNMSGLELLEKVRTDEKLKDLPFLMLTANNSMDKVKLAIDAGVNDYIAKPFQPDKLLAKMSKIIDLN